MISLITQLACI